MIKQTGVGLLYSELGRVSPVALLTVATVLAMSGCSKAELVNEWPAMGAPTRWEPRAGVCSDGFGTVSHHSAYIPMDCAGMHMYETVYVGQFKGDAAALREPPATDTTAYRAAWSECDAKTTEFLGADWQTGWIWIGISQPSTAAWDGGARWFRCEVAMAEKRMTNLVSRRGSLKGGFTKESSLRFGCFQATPDKPLEPVACTEPHNAEFVGVYASNESRDVLIQNNDTAHVLCRSVVATYVGVRDDGNLKYRTGTWYWVNNEEQWDAGDRKVRCYLYLTRQLTSSLKGAGTQGLPLTEA